ncbi:BMC domain-containing protein, partial [Propionibacterium acidifaciens]
MLTNALGEIEVLGLAAAIEAADVAVKAANVRLIGYETTDGAGMVTVKVEGQVSSVSAAVAAAAAAAARVSTVFATSVIPRPDPQLGDVVLSPLTVGLGAPTSADRPGHGAAVPTPP